MIERLFAFLVRHGPKLLAASILVGLALPALAAWIRPALTVLVWGMLFFSMLRIDWSSVVRHARRPILLLGAAAWLVVALPLIVWLLVRGLDFTPGLTAALVLAASSPPLIASAAFALLVGLDSALALLLMIVGTLSVPLTAPMIALEFLGFDLGVGVVEMMLRLAGFIGSCVAAAVLARRLAGTARLADAKTRLDGALVALLVAFAIGVMSGVTDRFLAAPGHVLFVAAIAFLANVGFQALAAAAFAWIGRMDALTIGLCAGNRNMAIIIAILPAAIDPDILLYFAMMQFPIYLLPVAQVSFYRWVLGSPPGHGRPSRGGT